MEIYLKLSFLVVLINSFINNSFSYSFSEELFVERVSNSYVQFLFQFKSSWLKESKGKIENYKLFPKRLGDIIEKFQIEELSLTLSQGTWKYNDWGLPKLSVPSGSELWTVFNKDIPDKMY